MTQDHQIPPTAVLFDLDGTLVDTYDLLIASFKHAVADVLGYDASVDHFDATIGQPLDTQFLWYAQGDTALRDKLSASYRAYNDIIHDETVRRFEGMDEVLDTLASAGVRMGVVTSKLHAQAEKSLRRFDMLPRFECLVGANDTAANKPAPDPVLAGARLMDVPLSKCAYVGDSPYDMQAAHAAGAYAVAALWGVFDESTLRACDPAAVCARPSDLPAALGL